MSCRSTTSVSMPGEHRRRSAAASRRTANESAARSSRRVTNGTFSSSMPRMPCSGLKSATSFTSGAVREQIDRASRRRARRPVWFVSSADRACRAAARTLRRASTSMPVRTGAARGASGAADARSRAPKAARRRRRGVIARRAAARPSSAAAATVATLPRSGVDVALAVGVHAVRQEDDVALAWPDRATATCR